jgi:hypothetical protein
MHSYPYNAILVGLMFNTYIYLIYTYDLREMEQRSRYSDWLRARRPRARSSSPGKVKIFLLSTSSRSVLRPIQPPIQWVTGLSSGLKRPGHEADHSPSSSAEVKNTWIYIDCPIRVHGAVIN